MLLLDEPTNDLDIDTLTALEDLLDGWPGTLVIASHDRCFVERVSDRVTRRAAGLCATCPGGSSSTCRLPPPRPRRRRRPQARAPGPDAGAGSAKAGRRELARLEPELDRAQQRVTELETAMAGAATDAVRLRALTRELHTLGTQRDELEERWLELSEQLDGR